VGQRQQSAAVRVDAAQVVAAMESLYEDRVQPHGRILLKRIGERMAAAAMSGSDALPIDASGLKCLRGRTGAGEVVPRIDTAHLRRVCERSKLLRAVPEEAGDYSVFLTGRPTNFVDACSEWDCFSEQFWDSAMAYFGAGGAGAKADLPGGRYACARALQALCPPFLQGFVLGEVCHVVQLAISHKKILGYLDGRIVPHRKCELVVKQHSAELQQPAWALKKDALPVADLPQARRCLQMILTSQCSQKGSVPMPNIKRLFRSQFGCELMETVFGYARLCDLLSSESFCDICELRLQNSTYTVLPRAQPHAQPETIAKVASATGSAGEGQESAQRWQPEILRTFIHLDASFAGNSCVRRKSLPKNWKLDVGFEFEECTRMSLSAALTPRLGRRLQSQDDPKAESSDDETTASDASPKDSSSFEGSDDEDVSLGYENGARRGAAEADNLRTPSPSPSPRLRGSSWMLPAMELSPSTISSSSCRTPTPSPRRYCWRGDASPAPASTVLSTMPMSAPVVKQPIDLCRALGEPSPMPPPPLPPVLPASLRTSAQFVCTPQLPRFSCSKAWADYR